jgi:hypothetical protein
MVATWRTSSEYEVWSVREFHATAAELARQAVAETVLKFRLAISMQKRTADERRWTQIARRKNADLSMLLRRHEMEAPS